jgi:hypothetical protein
MRAQQPSRSTVPVRRFCGFPSDRLLVDVKVSELAALLKAFPLGDPGLEHVFDY